MEFKNQRWAMRVSQRKVVTLHQTSAKNLTSFCMSGKETLISNKFGCLNKANVSLSVNIYLITGVLADPQTRITLNLQVLYLISKMITNTKILSSLTVGTKTPLN